MTHRPFLDSASSDWVFPACDLCGGLDGETFLEIQTREAPGGIAYIRKCNICGLRRLWPRPGGNVIGKYYGNDFGAFIGRKRSKIKQAAWDFVRDIASGAPGRGRRLKDLRPVFAPLAKWLFDIHLPMDKDWPLRVLDVGCGFGDLLLYWQSRGAEAVGVDIDERAISTARQLGLNAFQGELTAQDLPSSSFDVAVFNHSIEHIASPSEQIEEAARLLKIGGKIHIAVPNGASAGLSLERDWWQFLSFPIHLWFFDPETLTKTLEKAGFGNIRIHTSNLWRGRLANMSYARSISEKRRYIYRSWRIFLENRKSRNGGDLIRATAEKQSPGRTAHPQS